MASGPRFKRLVFYTLAILARQQAQDVGRRERSVKCIIEFRVLIQLVNPAVPNGLSFPESEACVPGTMRTDA